MIRDEIFISESTGEFVTRQQIIDSFVSESLDKDAKKRNYSKIRRCNNEMINEFGNFYHMFYGKILNLNIKPQYMIRFLYLCSYANYDNFVVIKNCTSFIKVKTSELQKMLMLANTDCFMTITELKKFNLITVHEDKTISINNEYVIKGKISGKKNTVDMEVVRMFQNGIKELYEKATPREHKRIALFIKMLPYINVENNIVCKNVLEKDINKVVPYTLKELTSLLEYKNSARLKNDLFAITVNGERAFMMIVDYDGKFFTVNPRIYCKSNNMERLMAISSYFRNKKDN